MYKTLYIKKTSLERMFYGKYLEQLYISHKMVIELYIITKMDRLEYNGYIYQEWFH